jgi:hypothetical protein
MLSALPPRMGFWIFRGYHIRPGYDMRQRCTGRRSFGLSCMDLLRISLVIEYRVFGIMYALTRFMFRLLRIHTRLFIHRNGSREDAGKKAGGSAESVRPQEYGSWNHHLQ